MDCHLHVGERSTFPLHLIGISIRSDIYKSRLLVEQTHKLSSPTTTFLTSSCPELTVFITAYRNNVDIYLLHLQ